MRSDRALTNFKKTLFSLLSAGTKFKSYITCPGEGGGGTLIRRVSVDMLDNRLTCNWRSLSFSTECVCCCIACPIKLTLSDVSKTTRVQRSKFNF